MGEVFSFNECIKYGLVKEDFVTNQIPYVHGVSGDMIGDKVVFHESFRMRCLAYTPVWDKKALYLVKHGGFF